MIKHDELKKIQEKYKNLENQLNQSVNDKDKYVSLSKEYAELKPLNDQINLFLAQQLELEELNSVINGNDDDLIEIAKSEIAKVKEKLTLAENALKELNNFCPLTLISSLCLFFLTIIGIPRYLKIFSV